jgi:hypothetical protein
MSMKRRIFALLAALVAVLGVSLISPTAASAHHTRYTDLYVSTAGVPNESILFGNHAGTSFRLSPGSSDCCYIQPDAYVPAGRDIIFFVREYPGWSLRVTGTGWFPVPRLASPQHVTARQVVG